MSSLLPSPIGRRTSLWLALACVTLRSFASAAEPRANNVLFIAIDDLTATLGCMGHAVVKTPHMDRLARSGVLFNRAYCQQPLCNPSRASMLTGLRPDTLKVYDLQTDFRRSGPRVITLPQTFRNQGYFSARVGKIYHYGVPRQIGSGGLDDADSWDWAINPRGRDKDEEDQLHVLTRGTGTTLGFAMAWREVPGTDDEQTDGIAVNETIRVLERYGKKRPLWLGMGFFRPHTPFVATRRWFDLYPKEKVTLTEQRTGDTDDIPPIALKIRPANYNLSDADLRDCLRAYYASVSFVDDQVGKLVAALERLQMADNTIIVLFSDHGFMLGEHGQWQKEMLFEESVRTPLIIVPAGGLRRPKTDEKQWKCDRIVELLDVYPTLIALAGLHPPRAQKLQGHDLSPLLQDPQAPWEHAALSQTPRKVAGKDVMGYSIRTERWRYTEWGENGEHGRELYDHVSDPREFTNLAHPSADAPPSAVRELKAQMEQMKSAGRAAANTSN